MRYIGIDLSKLECVTTIIDEHGDVRARFKFPNSPDGFRTLESRMEPGDELVLEASTYAYPIHDHFVKKGVRVHAAHAKGIRKIAQSESKNDWKDSFDLANLKRTNYFPAAYIPHPDVLRLRDVLRAQNELGQEVSRCKNRIRSFLARSGIQLPFPDWTLFRTKGLAWMRAQRFGDERDTLWTLRQKEFASIQDRQGLLSTQLAKIGVHDDRVRILMSVPGIDTYLALAILAEVGDIQRFPTVEGFRFYAGCAPRLRESAGVNRARGTVQGCSHRLKWAFSLVAKTLNRYPNPVHDYYLHELRKTRSKQRASARARRKVCDLVRALLWNSGPCRWIVPANFEFKRTRLERMARTELGLLDRPRAPGAA